MRALSCPPRAAPPLAIPAMPRRRYLAEAGHTDRRAGRRHHRVDRRRRRGKHGASFSKTGVAGNVSEPLFRQSGRHKKVTGSVCQRPEFAPPPGQNRPTSGDDVAIAAVMCYMRGGINRNPNARCRRSPFPTPSCAVVARIQSRRESANSSHRGLMSSPVL
jgi:hypothetical protein